MKIYHIICLFHLLLFLILSWALAEANNAYATEYIPRIQVIIAAFIYTFYGCTLSFLFWLYWHGSLRKRLLLVLVYLLITASLIPVLDFLIIELLPLVSIQFFDESREINDEAFHFRLIRGYLVVNLASLSFVSILKFFVDLKKRRNMEKEMLHQRDRMEEMKYTSHFLNSVFTTSFGRMLLDDAPKDKQTKMDIIQFLGELLKLEELGVDREWEVEMDLLECFIRLLRIHYGEDAITVEIHSSGNKFPPMPRGILLFPLENCLKHALMSPAYPVTYKLQMDEQSAILYCNNSWSPKMKMGTPGTGFNLLRAKIERANFPILLDTQLSEADFKLSMHLNWLK